MAFVKVGEAVPQATKEDLAKKAQGSSKAAPKEDPKALSEILQRPRNFPNFIDAYLDYTKNQESTRKIHKWVALSIIAAAMERKVFLNAGHFIIFPNLYIFIIGESGVVRKSTSTGIGVDLLRECKNVSVMSERVTSRSLIDQLARSKREFSIENKGHKQSAVYCYASELVVFLKEVYGSISELLTTFYDCSPQDSSKPWVYETKGEGRTLIYGPCLNILGASTSAWLTKAIPADEMEGGFSSRVIFVVERENPDNFVAWPELSPEVEALKPKLIQDLQQIHALRGNFTKTKAAHDFYAEWYVNFKKNAINQTDSRFKGYYGRKPTTIIKIAMALSVAEGNSLVFDRPHIEKAIALLDELEQSMFEAFGATGKNRLAEGTHKISEMVRVKKKITMEQIMRVHWRDLSGSEVAQIMDDLAKMGNITMEANGTKMTYIWKEKKGEQV
jgi:hypothetical protein